MAIYTYVYFLTDESPDKAIESAVKVDFKPSGNPTWPRALFTQILLIPHGLVLGVLGLAFILIMPWTIIVSLANEQYPKQFYEFVLKYMRWQTRVTAYLFSLTQEYPPFPGSRERPARSSRVGRCLPRPRSPSVIPSAARNLGRRGHP